MPLPTRSKYAEAVRYYPHISIRDPILKGGTPQLTKDGDLKSISGGFSIVFPIDKTSKTYALRCWFQDVGDNAEDRYKEISEYLRKVNLPYFVDFAYLSEGEGICVEGNNYPITRMEWVEGETLREFIEQNKQSNHIFKTIASEFQKMVTSLHKHEIAHGDLQDGNILLKRNGANVDIKLIDYDTLFVPKLKGFPDDIRGLNEYQHPTRMQRRDGQVNEKLDYFSELVIYLSFLSLAENPSLWSQFGNDKRVSNGLLFAKEDFEKPDQSAIFQELKKLSPEIKHLTVTLEDYCTKTSIDQLQPLEAILPKSNADTHTNHGFLLLKDKQYDKALSEFQKAIAKNPNYKKACYGMGLVHLHSKRYSEAIHAFDQAIGKDPKYKEAYYGLGLVHFKSGDDNKAKLAINEALKIDPHYQDAKWLLDAILNKSISPPLSNFWNRIVKQLTNYKHITTGVLVVGLIICFVAFLTQMDAKEKALSQNTELNNQLAKNESDIRQKASHILNMNTSIKNLKNDNETLNKKNRTLQNELTINAISENANAVSLRKLLNEEIKKNRQLQEQLTQKTSDIRKLQNEKIQLSNNRSRKNNDVTDQQTSLQQSSLQQLRKANQNLQTQLTAKTSIIENLTTQVKKLQSEIQLLTAQKTVSKQLPEPKENTSNKIAQPEQPKKVNYTLDYRVVIMQAKVSSNHGFIAFEKKEYSKAIAHFKQAIEEDVNFSVAHYNLGCTYFQMKDFRKAISAFNTAVSLNPKFKEAFYNRSLAYIRTNRIKEAQQDLQRSLKIDTNYQLANSLLKEIRNR